MKKPNVAKTSSQSKNSNKNNFQSESKTKSDFFSLKGKILAFSRKNNTEFESVSVLLELDDASIEVIPDNCSNAIIEEQNSSKYSIWVNFSKEKDLHHLDLFDIGIAIRANVKFSKSDDKIFANGYNVKISTWDFLEH